MIEVKAIADGEAFVILVDSPESIENFKQLIQRGANLWPDAQPEIKEFADLITNGRIFQDYGSQAKDKIHTCEHANTRAINPTNGYYLYCLDCKTEFNRN